MVSINEEAVKVVKNVIKDAARLGVKINKLSNGTTILDMGINADGSWQAGIEFVKLNMGNLGMVDIVPYQVGDLELSGVLVHSDQVVTSTIASQIAGWKITNGDNTIIGSGPARAQAIVESDYYFEMTDYRDQNDECVLCLQMEKLPDVNIANQVAKACGVTPENIYLVVAPSASLVGSIQVAARSVEQTVHKMFEHDFNLKNIKFAKGLAPIAPIINDETEAMGRINDALLYGGYSEFWVDCDDDEIIQVINHLVSGASDHCGEPFSKLYSEAENDFYKMDKNIHAMSKVKMHNMKTGKLFEAGTIHTDVIKESYTSQVLK